MRLTRLIPAMPATMAVPVLTAIAVLLNFNLILPSGFCLTTDEAFSWRVASQPNISQLIAMTGKDVHPPLYYLALSGWMAVFGQSEIALRSLSGAFGVATVLATYWYAIVWIGVPGRRGGTVPAFWAAVLVALSLTQVSMAHFARMYNLMSLLALLTCGLLLSALRRPRGRVIWILYAITASLLVYTHNYGLYLVTGQALWVGWEVSCQADRAVRRVTALSAAMSFVSIGVSYLPWVPWLRLQLKLVTADYWIKPLSWKSLATVPVQVLSVPLNELPPIAWHVAIGAIVLTLLILWPWRKAAGERQTLCVFGLHVFGIAASALVAGRSLFVPRYLIYLLPLCAIPVSYWICQIGDRIVFRAVLAWLVFMAIYVLASTVETYRPVTEEGADLRRVVAEILSNSNSDEPVVTTSRSLYLVLKYYMERHRPGQPCALFDPELQAASERHLVFASGMRTADLWVPNPAEVSRQRCWLVADGIRLWEPPGLELASARSYVIFLPSGFDTLVRVAEYRPSAARGSGRTPTTGGGKP